jgi:hypothetical protein
VWGCYTTDYKLEFLEKLNSYVDVETGVLYPEKRPRELKWEIPDNERGEN